MKLSAYIKSICFEYKAYFIALFFISISASFLGISVNYKIKEIIDKVAANNGASIGMLLLLFFVYKFCHHGMFFLHRLLNIRYKPGFTTKVTSDVYSKIIGHSLHWFDSRMSGEISDKINGFQQNLSNVITNIFRASVILWSLFFGIIFLARVNILSSLVILIFMIIYFPIMCWLLKKQMKLQQKYVEASQETSGIINDSIANIFSIKVVGNLLTELKLKLTPSLLNKQEKDRQTRRFDAFFIDNFDTALTTIMSAAQIYLLAYLYQNNQITAGGFAFVAMITLNIHGDIDKLLDCILFEISPQVASIRTSYNVINSAYDVVDSAGAKILNKASGSIKFADVDFAYNAKENNILSGFNLNIKAGEKIGLVGYSGAGKTTLIKCLLRYFDVRSGAILLDGNDIRNITQESLRQNIAVIPQDITMFHRSILDNIKIAKYDADFEEIIAACKKAKIHDDIMKMANGYDSIVGERGVKVSGGQRQRIAIARAILKDAPILILDEATSSLDSQTERQIQESLNLLIEDKSKTVIAIAHRLSTLKHMDRIIVIDKGQIAEEGSHDQLILSEKSLYKKLWELQEI